MVAKAIKIFNGSLGLNNRIDPARLRTNAEDYISCLAEAVNVDIDNSGRISRRKGFKATTETGNCHSMFCDGGDCLLVSGDKIYRLNKDYTKTELGSGLTPGAKMAYVQVAGKIYHCNGHENGIYNHATAFENYSVSNWTAGSYVGQATTKTFSDPPVGETLEYFKARIYIGKGETVWYTERRAYSWVNLADNWIDFDSPVTMIQAVDGGLFISTTKETFFFAGNSPLEFDKKKVSDYPAIKGTDTKVEGSLVEDGITGRLPVWVSKSGICLGLPDGGIINLTEKKLVYPPSNYGVGAIVDSKYIGLLEP